MAALKMGFVMKVSTPAANAWSLYGYSLYEVRQQIYGRGMLGAACFRKLMMLTVVSKPSFSGSSNSTNIRL